MAKRAKLEIMKDILSIIKDANSIKITPLLRKSNISFLRFKEYYSELLKKNFVKETINKKNKTISLSEKGFKFLEKYRMIINFIDEFEL